MPTYQYACKDCDYHFEQVQAFSDPSLTDCPECSGRLRKVYGSVGVVFKGSGFYRTDSRSGSGKASLSADHKGEASTSSNGSTDHATSSPTKTLEKAKTVASAAASSSASTSAPAKAAS